jgi:hypothetical protein
MPYLHDCLLIQAQRIVALGKLLDLLRPQVVVTEYDRNFFASVLVQTANIRNIPTITMMHGVINPPYGYTPVLAKKVLCWGRRQLRQLIELGVEEQRVKVTGCHRLRRGVNVNVENVKRKLFSMPTEFVAILATNPGNTEEKERLVEIFCEGVVVSPGVSGVVRLHPSEKVADYSKFINKYPQIKFILNDVLTFEESLAISDVVVGSDSGFCTDALILGQLVVIVETFCVPLKNGRELIERAGCPSIKSSIELSEILKKVDNCPNYRKLLHARSHGYREEFCGAFGSEAVANVVGEIQAQAQMGKC